MKLSFCCHRGAVPPGARFDPFGPVPPGGSRSDSRSGRFAGYVAVDVLNLLVLVSCCCCFYNCFDLKLL